VVIRKNARTRLWHTNQFQSTGSTTETTNTVTFTISASTFPSAYQPGVWGSEAGNIYSTTQGGGACKYSYGYGCGTVFQLTKRSSSARAYQILHFFRGKPAMQPVGGPLVFDKVGDLYGMTAECGGPPPNCYGVIFHESP
jgi:hypothetical protein